MIATYITAKLRAFGWNYNDTPGILEEIITYCQNHQITPEEFDKTITAYRQSNVFRPSGIISLFKFMPNRNSNKSKRAVDIIFSAIETCGWDRAIDEIMRGMYGTAAIAFLAAMGITSQTAAYCGLPQSWQTYFRLLHNGQLEEAFSFMHKHTGKEEYQQLAMAARTDYRTLANRYPIVRYKLKTGQIVPPPEVACQYYANAGITL